MNMSAFFDHPIVEKATAAIIAAVVTTIGAFTLSTRDQVNEHSQQLKQVVEMRADLSAMRTSLTQVEINVAVLKDRSDSKGPQPNEGRKPN